jgi:hypothetical protein
MAICASCVIPAICVRGMRPYRTVYNTGADDISGEFTENATLTVTGGSGKYAGATGTITLEGLAHNLVGPGLTTFNVIYQGSVCGPNLKADGN